MLFATHFFTDLKKVSIYEPGARFTDDHKIILRHFSCLCCLLEMPEKRVGLSGNMSQTMTLCQEMVIKWFANYTMPIKKPTDTALQQPTKAV